MRVVATAGHVDHGKSSLILALTGTDPDRLPEEKARGLTIDLGFAFMELDGETVGFVDVPGHVKFVKNMLAGVGAVDVAIVVVAANEGWMPQTEEHVNILELLGVAKGIVVLSKAGMVDAERLDDAQLELLERLGTTGLASWPLVVCDSISGEGISATRDALAAVLATTPRARDEHRPRLWVDRSFASKGAGTVVTGTLTLGTLHIDDEVVIEPGMRRARVRGIESHHRQLDVAAAGSRVALNLAGIEHHEVGRGDVIVTPRLWSTTASVDVRVLPLPGAALPQRGRLSVHVGSGEFAATWRNLDDGGSFGRLRFDCALPLRPGDRVVLRSTARRTTVAGAEVVDIAPARRASDALERVAAPLAMRVVAATPWATLDDFVRSAGLDPLHGEATVAAWIDEGLLARVGAWFTAPATLDRSRAALVELVRAHHRAAPGEPGLDLAVAASKLQLEPAQLRALVGSESQLVIERDVVRTTDHRAAATASVDGAQLLAALEARPFAPPSAAEVGVSAQVARLLVREGLAVDLDGVLFATSAIDRARHVVADALSSGATLTIADLRDLLGSTRKYVIPIIKRLDAEGVTRRRGDDRIAGPRAAAHLPAIASED